MKAISTAQFTNAMISAFEGGSSHWVTQVRVDPAKMEQYRNSDHTPWYSNNAFWLDKSYAIDFTYDTTDGFGEYETVTVKWPQVKAGIQTLHDRYPDHYRNLVTDNDDAETGDALLQCIVLGDIDFG